jgi:hypothetical protein
MDACPEGKDRGGPFSQLKLKLKHCAVGDDSGESVFGSYCGCHRAINASTLVYCISQFCPLRSDASNVAAHRTCTVPSARATQRLRGKLRIALGRR